MEPKFNKKKDRKTKKGESNRTGKKDEPANRQTVRKKHTKQNRYMKE